VRRSANLFPPKRVLLVYQSEGAQPGAVEFEQRLERSLHAAMGPDLEFYREQLDMYRFPQYEQNKIAAIRSQYADRKIDVIVFFFGNTVPEILPGVPVVQISNSSADLIIDNSRPVNTVHVFFNIDARKIYEMARRLQPKTRKVLLISGTDSYERATLAQFHERLSEEPNLDIQDVDNASVPELLALVSRLPREAIVLPVGIAEIRQEMATFLVTSWLNWQMFPLPLSMQFQIPGLEQGL
jgi:hypothetical protein